MAWEFHVGQRVVCVDDNFRPKLDAPFVSPAKGGVYTIRAVMVGTGEVARYVFLWLMEIRNPNWIDEGVDGEPAWQALGFRPLDERRLDQFRAQLVPATRQPELV